nr:hypothetical protein [uncultured Clostridium sp.]
MDERSLVPFEVEHTRFTAYWGEPVEIWYSGKNNSVSFRMAHGTDDVSGDSTVYEINENATAGGIVTSIKEGGAAKQRCAAPFLLFP